MASNNMVVNWILVTNLLAGGAFVFYMIVLWLEARGRLKPTPGLRKLVRYGCLFCVLTPLAARYQYSETVILYFSAGIFVVAGLIMLKQKMGL